MTSPSVQGTAATTAVASATSHPINLPSGILNNELIVLITGFGSDPGTVTATGWTTLLGGTNSLPGAVGVEWAAYRIVTSAWPGVATTETITSSIAAESASICFRVKHYNTSSPFSGANGATGTSASPTCTNFGPIASDDMLVIAAYIADGTDLQGVPVYPSGYTALAQIESGSSATTSATVGAGWKAVTGTDETPGAFTNTLTASQEWFAPTFAIASGTGGELSTARSLTGGMKELTGGIRG